MGMKGNAAFLGGIQPVSQGVGAVSTGYVDASKYNEFVAVIQAGVLGAAATLDAKIEQATTSGGTGVKDVTGAVIVQILKATGDNDNAIIHLRAEQLDVNGGFDFIRLTCTVGAAASLISASLWGCNPRYKPEHAASVVQEVTTP